jgi:hypothetical protein
MPTIREQIKHGAHVVYGYLRAEEPDDSEIARLSKEMSAYCTDRGYQFASVCCDRQCTGLALRRPGFTAALDALALPTSLGLLVPALRHLSTDEEVRESLIRLVRRTGATLFVLQAPDGMDRPNRQISGQS